MSIFKILAIGALRAYQWVLRPVLPMGCRYLPTCSDYALEAVQRHGVLRGGLLAAWRLGRCHPWGGEGLDPVPERFRLLGRAHFDRDRARSCDCGALHRDHI